MSFVGDVLGLGSGGGGSSGSTFQAQKANLLSPVNSGQADTAYNQSQQGLNTQADFLQALQMQNGIGNQANVFAQQQALAGQLQGIANGTGPNPALQQLQNTTGQNVANQAALMASQRGTGANAGLLARQAAQQGAQIQQQAAGQGAALSAEQQLAGLRQLQAQQQSLGNLASQQVGQQAAATTGYNQAAQSEQQNLLNSIAQLNNANVAMTSNVNNVQGNIANTVTQGQQSMTGGLLGGLGSVGTALGNVFHGPNQNGGQIGDVSGTPLEGMFKARGGLIQQQHYADGGAVQINMPSVDPMGPQSNVGKYLYGSAPSQSSAEENQFSPYAAPNAGAQALQKGASSGVSDLIGPAISMAGLLASKGAVVPGKASVKGDSLKNDTVPAVLSPGEIVIPRHVVNSKDPAGNAAKFVAAVLAKKGRGLSK